MYAEEKIIEEYFRTKEKEGLANAMLDFTVPSCNGYLSVTLEEQVDTKTQEALRKERTSTAGDAPVDIATLRKFATEMDEFHRLRFHLTSMGRVGAIDVSTPYVGNRTVEF